jgi:peptide/nickel transport system substrate-binding protein
MTVRITTNGPDPLLEKRLAMLFVVPKAVYQAAGTKAFGLKPVGTGQYAMSELAPNKSFTAKAVPGNWKGAPATSEIATNVYTDNNAFLAATESGQLDVAQQLPSEATTGISGYEVKAIPVGSPFLLQLNTTQKPFDDVRVRQAVNHAVNIDAIIRVILNGVGVRLKGQLPGPDCFGHNPKVVDYAYDVKKAKALLADAGLAAGFDTELVGQARDRALLEAISGELAKVNIRAKVTALDYSVWVEGFNKGTQYPMFAKGLDYGPLYDADQSYQWVTAGDEGRKGWIDKKWDDMLAQSRQELDTGKRKAILLDMAQYLHDQAPFLFLFSQEWVIASRKGVSGLDLSTGKWIDAGKAKKSA